MKKLSQLLLILALCGNFGLAQVVISGTATLSGTLTCAPADAATYPNLQALGAGGWTVQYGTTCCGGSNSGTGTGAWGISSPSLSGGSMSLTNVYTGSAGNGLNSQMFTVLNCSILSGASCLSANNVTAEVHVYIPSTSATPQALEGPNVILYDGTDQEYPSLQCRVSGSDWWVWNSGGGAWVDSGNSCAGLLTTNTWHDIKANYTIDGVAHTLGYVSVYLDGVSQGTFGQSYSGMTDGSSVALKAQVQLDGNESGASTTAVNYDKYDVTVTTNPVAATPTASPAAGSYSSTQSVTLTSSTAGASIYYTTDGSTPTTSSTLYTGAISVASTTTIKALATKSGYTQSGVFSGTYTITGGGSVATPTFSVASGSVAPGTPTTPSDSTSGAVVAYTTDGTTPGCQSYTAGSATPILGTGTTMIYRHQVLVDGTSTTIPDPTIYGPVTFKAIGCKNGLTPSSVATYAYTLTAPSGTGISACTSTLTGTNYLTANVSSTGTCFGVTAANTILNLNGHTLTYGTASGTVQSGTGMSLTSSSTTATCSGCSFTSALNGLRLFADNYNTGGYQNTSDTTTVTYVNATTLTLSSAPAFTTTNAEWFIANAPVYGVSCDPSIGQTCNSLIVENGTITQGNVLDPPNSSAIAINPINYSSVTGPLVFSGLTFNISAPEALAIDEDSANGADVITGDTINDAVTQIYYRDGLQYPIVFRDGPSPNTTPTKLVWDNQILNSPQGGLSCDYTCYGWNNYVNNTTSTQYANGYGMLASSGGSSQAAAKSSFAGNTILGATRGMEMDEADLTAQYNQVNVEDSGSVQDPNHNPTGCEIDGGYGIRTKDFSSGVNGITGEVIDSNLITVTTGPCGGQAVRFTQIGSSDGGVISNNNYNLVGNTTVGPSSFNSIDDADMTGFTYSGATYTKSGADASSLYDAYIWYDGGVNWTLPGLTSPQIYYESGTTNSNAAFSGTGTPACTLLNGGGGGVGTFTWNGSSLPCP